VQDAVVPLAEPAAGRARRARLLTLTRSAAPTRVEFATAVLSALLLVLAFPDFNLWPLAWVGLAPLLFTIARRPRARQSFVLGWTTGALFFYGSCWWLTYSMIHYGRLPGALAYALLIPGALIVGLFPALFCLVFACLCLRWGACGLFAAPPLWVALEWARLGATGQLWNAIGYSQAYQPELISAARWGGVYAVGFLIVAMNAALAYALLRRNLRALLMVLLVGGGVALVSVLTTSSGLPGLPQSMAAAPAAVVIAVQPNVDVNFDRAPEETAELIARHLSLSADALKRWDESPAGLPGDMRAASSDAQTLRAWQATPRVVVWPESPMNFTYTQDAEFRALVAEFASTHRTAVLFNSQEPAPAGGAYNSAVLVNDEGRLVAQYDKIRLLPFGEYVPLPRWFPGAWLLSGLVGDFTPGTKYPLMPLGDARGGVFICFESAFPEIARTFTRAGADVLINISNDGYLGRTPVLRQHLANAVFRAVENERPVLRVTNTGISAYITARGEVQDATNSFEPAVRTWPVAPAAGQTFYTRHGELFVALCALISVLLFVLCQWPTMRRARLRQRAPAV
jgi:apolipoprotein N-acyltransferase